MEWSSEEREMIGKHGIVVGVDEAGRGCLAGPVVAAAVAFAEGTLPPAVQDSKKLSSKKREELFDEICESAVSIGVGIVERDIIDEVNILNATWQAMNEAASQIEPLPKHLLIDGNRYKGQFAATPIIKGDDRCLSIAAASIIAKVTRDRIMVELDNTFPLFGFAKHKGYATAAHKQAIRQHGITPEHRLSFLSFLRKEQQTLPLL